MLVCMPAHASDIGMRVISREENFAVITVNGVITVGDTKRMDRLLTAASLKGKPIAVWFDAHGGDLVVAMELGKMMRTHHVTTYNAYCSSVCIFAFLGGTQRIVALNGNVRLDVSRPSEVEAYTQKPLTTYGAPMLGILRDYIVDMTGSPDFYDLMMKIPSNEPKALSLKDAVSMHVATAVLH
jgi:hypothetical protein